MSDTNGPLSAEEEAHFTSRGAKPVPGDTSPPPAAEPTEPAAEETAEQTAARVRDEKTGRFAKKDGEPEATAETDTEEVLDEVRKVVPVKAFTEERTKRQQAEQEKAKLAGRLEAVLEMMRRPEQPEQQQDADPEPDKQADYIAWNEWQHRQNAKSAREFNERKQQEEQYRQNAAQFNQFATTVKAKTQEYAATVPDYDDAYKFLKQSRYDELIGTGYSQQDAADILERNEVEIAALAMRQGANPGERVYQLAKKRGFAGKPKAAAQTSDAERLATVQRGQAASRSLSQASGSPPAGKIDWKVLANMEDDDFIKATSDRKKFREIMLRGQ